jgi:hypothetical protein
MTFVYAAPAWLLTCIITLLFVAVACGGHAFVHRRFKQSDFIEHNEVAGFIVAVVGVLFAVLLAFTTVIVWERFAQAEDRASEEVDAATDIYRLTAHLEPADRLRISTDIDTYARSVSGDEWPRMTHGESSPQTQRLVIRILADIVDMHVATRRESNIQNHLLDRAQIMSDLRRRRINDNRSGVPPVMWFALLLGAAVVIGFIYLFGLKNFTVQLLMTAATAMLIGLSFSVLVALDYPFRGDVSVPPERWIALYEIIEQPAQSIDEER